MENQSDILNNIYQTVKRMDEKLDKAEAHRIQMDKQRLEDSKDREKTIKGVVTIIASMVMHLVLGTLYIWGTVKLYITSYFRSEGDLDLKSATVGLVFPFMMFAMAFGLPIGVRTLPYFGSPRKMGFIVIFLIALFVFISSFIRVFGAFVFTYSICFGFLTGLMYMTPIYVGMQFFPNRKGVISGLVLTGYGFGSFIFNYVCLAICNPDNLVACKNPGDSEKFYQDCFDKNNKLISSTLHVAEAVPSMWRYLALSYLLIGWLSSFFLFDPNEFKKKEEPKKQELPIEKKSIDNNQGQQEQGKAQYIELQKQQNEDVSPLKVDQDRLQTNAFLKEQPQKEQDMVKITQPAVVEKPQCPDIMTGVKTIIFWVILIEITCSSVNGLLLSGNYKDFGNYKKEKTDDNFISDSFLTLIGSISAIANGGLRPIWALVYEKIGFRLFSNSNQIWYLIWVFVTMSCYGGQLTFFPPTTVGVYGIKMGSQIYGLDWFGFTFANFIQFGLVLGIREDWINAAGVVNDLPNFPSIFYVVMALNIVAFILQLIFKMEYDWAKRLNQSRN